VLVSTAITEASKRRMSARDEFVSLNPKGYVSVESEEGLPVLDIDLRGVPQSADIAEEMLNEVKAFLASEYPKYKLVMRQTA
jgi:hypothetical protein